MKDDEEKQAKLDKIKEGRNKKKYYLYYSISPVFIFNIFCNIFQFSLTELTVFILVVLNYK